MGDKKKHQDLSSQNSEGSNSEFMNRSAIEQFKNFRKIQPSADELIRGILAGNRTDLSRSITLIESTNPEHLQKANTIINTCLPHANNSIRIGITGVPGVGKSSFIEVFGKHLTSIGKKVAVLTIDPSSSISHGSILGDKTRMASLTKDKNAYIRPSASGSNLGGVARKTRETITLCEAAGFDTILIETVGVGQSEIAVHSMVDFFLLLQVSGTGDELQGIKKGIMEMADAIVINKADGDNIQKTAIAKAEITNILPLFAAKKSGWKPVITSCSSKTKEGISEIWEIISKYVKLTKDNTFFETKRSEQNEFWLMETVEEQLKQDFFANPEILKLINKTKKAVQNNEYSPFAAAQLLVEIYFKSKT